MASRVVKLDADITMTAVTQSDGREVINRAYSVRAKDPTSLKTFCDIGAAETYFEELVLLRLKPN
jgi:hypothetical protein